MRLEFGNDLEWRFGMSHSTTTQRSSPLLGPTRPRIGLSLLGGWRATAGDKGLNLPTSAQRLVALMALKGHVSRAFASGVLWCDVTEHRAHASLRSTLWRISQICPSFVVATDETLALAPDVRVDVVELKRLFTELLWHPELDVEHSAWAGSLAGDLLPGWNDEWVQVERERLRQMRVQALEAITRSLTDKGEFARALEVGMLGVAVAPLRESAHREIIRIHLAEGNHAEALRQFEVCSRLLSSKLGLGPSQLMSDLMSAVPSTRPA
jgi:DNA-binding SARP family transcriptional activator